MTFEYDINASDLERFSVYSRREIISLLRNVGARNQLVRMQPEGSGDSVVTSVLHVDEASNSVVIDCAPSRFVNERILESETVQFETVLDNIRIRFSATGVESCDFDERPALLIALPEKLIRLQRREFYRVQTPIAAPVKCSIPVTDAFTNTTLPVTVALANVSAGGIGVMDDRKLIAPEIGKSFPNCRIDIPGGPVALTLQLRNSQDLTLSNGKQVRRLGFMFIEPPTAVVASVQRYITKLEREENARKTGMG
jgi:c-di-GMP-binding flagellar brake protein YcgR